MGSTVRLPWGNGLLTVNIPDNWRLLGELRPNAFPANRTAAEACAEALRDPISAPPLASRNLSGKRVAVVVDDHSRPTPVADFIAPVLEELAQAGARPEDIEILIATGVHRATEPEEAQRKIGAEAMAAYKWRVHNAHDPEGLADLGTTARGTRVFLNKRLTQVDLIVCMGALEPHILLGFGGGLKMLIPGLAGAETIGANHLQGLEPDKFDYVGVSGDESPMRLDLEEGAGMLKKEIFIVNAVMNESGTPVRFFCGDPVKAHRQGEAFVESLMRLDVPEQADVVLANSFPMDSDLRQSAKCLGNTLFACKPGGVMLGFLRCDGGLGEIPLAARTPPYPVMRGLLKIIGKKRVLGLVERAKKGQPVEEKFVGHFGLQMLRRCHLGLFTDSPLIPEDIGRRMGLARSFKDLAPMFEWAASKAPRSATVWVAPAGGCTYARS